jgi:UDP-GlcNAc:undecaprenyl-phosphate/decaprenyl-phosphate GlcNAc-1-phosphate transferase
MSFTETLDALVDEAAVAWGLLLAALLVIVLTPLVSRLAIRIGAFDAPNRDRPRVHTQPIPRIGGLAIAVGILVPALIFVDLSGPLAGIVLAIPVVAAIGLVDDLRGLSARTKLLAVMAAALIPVIGYDMHFERIGLPFVRFDLEPAVAIPLTLLWIALVANLVNLIDGMDALAAGIVAIASATLAVLAMSFGRVEAAAIAAIVCGATVGFLRHNYHPAKIFMGDSGALTLGFVLGSLAVEGVLKTPATIALMAPLLIIAVPILDTAFVVAKRLKYRRRPWAPDQNHFYHRFLRIGYSQRRTAAYLHVWAGVLAGYAMLVRFVPPRPLGVWDPANALICAVAGAVVIAGSVWMVYELEILKARHFQVLGLRRPPASIEEPEAAVEEIMHAREPEPATAAPAPAAPPDHAARGG